MENNYVVPHEAAENNRVKLLAPIFRLLPSRVQRWACGCAICEG